MEWLATYLAAYLAAYLLLGLATGVVAGLLGVGGGLVMVPVLTTLFAQQGFPPAYNMHLALGTSLAVISPTSIASLRAHHAHGAVDWTLFRHITPGVLLGGLLGGAVIAQVPSGALKLFFVAFLLYAATQMWFEFRPKPSRALPGRWETVGVGSLIGAVSSWVGIGGGTLSVPFQIWCNVPLHRAIGTSAAIGLPIAIAGSVGFFASGQSVSGLPSGSAGFLYLPAVLTLAVATSFTAPWGATLAHRLPVHRLKKLFAGLLYLLAVRMATSLWLA